MAGERSDRRPLNTMTVDHRADREMYVPVDAPQRWVLVSTGDPADRWAWSGIPESIAVALRRRGDDVVRVSCDLPRLVGVNGARIARRIPGLAVTGNDASALVALRSARLRRIHADWAGARVVTFGSTWRTPRVDATFEDATVVQVPQFPPSGARRRWQRRQAAIYNSVSRCFASSEWAAASIRGDYGQPRDKVTVVGFGPNVVCRPVPKDWSRPRFLWVGMDWKRKGGDGLLEAFRQAEIPGATLDLVGQHPSIDVAGVTGHGRIHDPARLSAMFEAATLFILPSQFDACPIVCLEAATAGTPIIATRTGGTVENVGAAGVLIQPGDVRGLAASMVQMSDPAVAESYRQAAIAQAQTRSWDRVVDRMIDAFERGDSRSPTLAGSDCGVP